MGLSLFQKSFRRGARVPAAWRSSSRLARPSRSSSPAIMRHNPGKSQLHAVLALFVAFAVASCGGGNGEDGQSLPILDADGCTVAPAAPTDTPVCRGKASFHDRGLAGLGGNGRACSDCHMDSEN